MRIADRILIEAMLAEFRGKREPIGGGAEKEVYASTNPDVLIVKARGANNMDSLYRIIADYKKYPHLLARPIRLFADKLAIEKLDTEAFKREADIINKISNNFMKEQNKSDELRISIHYFTGEALQFVFKSIEYDVDEAIDAYVEESGKDIKLWRKWWRFVKELIKCGLADDLHDGQAGLDKAGNIKLFDY